MDSSLCGVETLVDIKGLRIDEPPDHTSFRAEQGQLKPIYRWAVKAHKEYSKAAKDLDSKHHHSTGDEIGPVKPLFCHSCLWRASTRARLSGSESAASEGYLLDTMTFARSSHAAVRCPNKWIATTASHQRMPLSCSGEGSVACGAARPFSPGATSSWTGAASSLVCSRPPPAPRARVAGGDSDPNFENCNLFHGQSLDTGRGVNARSWRANHDIDVRR